MWGLKAVVAKTGLSPSTLYAYFAIGCTRSSDGSACGASLGGRPMSGPGSQVDLNRAGTVVHDEDGVEDADRQHSSA